MQLPLLRFLRLVGLNVLFSPVFKDFLAAKELGFWPGDVGTMSRIRENSLTAPSRSMHIISAEVLSVARSYQ